MNRIVFISPYRDLSIMAKSVAEELGLAPETEFYEGWLEEAGKIVRKLDGPPIDILMSRGGTAAYLTENFTIPVIKVNTGPYDMLEGLYDARQFSRNIAITTFSESFIGLRLMEKVLDISITEVLFKSLEDLEPKIAALAQSGEYCILGGGPSVSFAKKYGLSSVFLRTSRATLHSAFQNADQLACLRKEETRKSYRLNAILDAAYDGIIAVDANGIVEIYNKSAEKTFNKPAAGVIGKKAIEVIPNTHLDKILESGQTEIGELQDVNNTRILTNRVPVKYGLEIMGAVATFQESSKVVQAEQKIRKELTGRGQFRAKANFSDIIGASGVLEMKKNIARRFAQSELTLLLYGVSGTGKELFAQSIHNAGQRAGSPFVAVNCGALPPSLLESELFGYEEGAFTGARRKGKYGLFELAHGGTIFLDEIDALPIEMQGRLLRVLQEREVLRIGGESIIPVNVRVIAATNQKPEELLRKNLIREDLFYRLNVLYLEIPPLSERTGDIQSLCEHFLSSMGNQHMSWLLKDLLPYFERYKWPGNVRELQNTIQRLAFFADSFEPGQKIEKLLHLVAPNILEATQEISASDTQQIRGQLKDLENELILKAVEEQGTLDKAAAYLGIGRSTLTRKLKEIRQK